ncbi:MULTISPECIES: SDR family oxidoreductase [Paraburkholderia]|uniref:SDR family oxidoreductase n=1 Tax=Paraburkholderia madseniana TaxID=2599607 RepID=A0AAP5ET61_9BURK|nr:MULTISPECIES: SDR family oxidoreductase [Paraburkholderia]MCX4152212.1 SDR family oxidoreductase [Paraburkholderia madseniana]MDN7155140.1 SDR family oxidoreductase [Paraburkholderia sp. WS6]MDQ6414023.1 SDR family oxidoreductase [Paraburkholderia madseniana]
MNEIIVTGANGFVGRVLCRLLVQRGYGVTGLVRHASNSVAGVREWVDSSVDFAGIDGTWPQGLKPDCVVHLAARVHMLNDDAADPEAAFHATNVEGALRVAEAAVQRGARRFVFVSSVKAIAEIDAGRALREDDPPLPQDPYGRSKLEAERALVQYGIETGLDVVIVRPPLVYGPEVRANFLRLLDAISKGLPLPLAMASAKRSLVYVDNLADALMHCASDPRAAHQCFHVADGGDPSVAELVEALGKHLQKPARLFPVPVNWLRLVGRVTGRSAQIDRLVGGLQVDTNRIHSVLDWQPPISTDEGLAETARWYRSTH